MTSEPTQLSGRSPFVRHFATMLSITFIAEVCAMSLLHLWAPDAGPFGEAVLDGVILTALVVPTAWALVVAPLRRALRREHDRYLSNQAELQRQLSRHHLDAQLNRAFDMATAEPDVLGITQRALRSVCPEHAVEVLLADASHAHLRRAVLSTSPTAGSSSTVPSDTPKPESTPRTAMGCPVESPNGCVAARRGQVMHFESRDALDTCPHFARSGSGARSATCVPLSIAGRAVGVLHAFTQKETAHDDVLAENLQIVSTQTGARLGMLRAMAASELAATTDPLSGLLNRRSLSERARQLENTGTPYSLVACDLDHFKRLNDTFGHAAGDQAIKTFARVLKTCCRPDDCVARAGGEEFVILLPNVHVADAEKVAARVQTTLKDIAGRVGAPEFTVSFGVGESLDGRGFEELMRQADQALYTAKRAGRDCIRRVGDGAPELDAFAGDAAVIAESDARQSDKGQLRAAR